MYAVIFRAEINEADDTYSKMAAQMRCLAESTYGCTEFTAVVEGNKEIAISYWQSLEQIALWKNDVNHMAAQELGRSKWYKEYQVQVVEIMREYRSKT